MGCALVISSLYPLDTFGRPFVWQALNKYFFDLYWITSSCFPSENCLACSNSPWNIRTNANSFLFLFTTHIACQKFQKFPLCFFSPFSCQCANTHHESYLFHRTHCVSPTNCASLLFWIPSVVCLYFSNALHYIYFHALSYINNFCTFESQWFKIFALCVFLPMWWWLSNSILNKHPFQFYEMGKIKIWPISQGNSHHHLLCESILQTIKFYEPFNEYVVILVGLHALAQLSGRNRHKYLVDIKFNQMFGWQPYMSWFRNPSSVHLETLQSSRIYGPNLEGTFIMPTQIPLARTHP